MGCAASAPRAGTAGDDSTAECGGKEEHACRSESGVAGAKEGGMPPDRHETEGEAGGESDAELARRLMAGGFTLVEEDKVAALGDWVRSLVSLDKAETGVQYRERHVEALLAHVQKVLAQVAAELKWELGRGGCRDELSQLLHLVEEKLGGSKKELAAQERKKEEVARWEARCGWGAVLAKGGVEAAYERVVAGALYTHGMSCEKKAVGEACTHADCDQQVSLYKVVNTAMRLVGEWDEEKKDEAVPAQHAQLLSAFQPLVARLQGLLWGLPKAPQVVFRGITLNLSLQYKVGGQKVWHSFSSTSLVKGEAANFVAEGERRGMMFAVATRTQAVDIDFANLYGERELLYAPNTVFNVAWKLSPTLLRMLGLQYDVVVLTEESGAGTETELRLCALRDVMMHTVEFFKEFLSRYVEGRVATGRQAGTGEGQTCLLERVRAWLSEEKKGLSGGRHPLCLLGGGGTGKTSAALALMGWLLGAETINGRPVFPVFVPLPALRMKERGLLAEGGIDEYVRESFGLTAAEQERLREDYDVVLVLDSLDEVGVGPRELADAVKVRSLLSLHPWCASCSVVVTTRGEYLEAGGLVPAHVCGSWAEALYLQPFTHDDVEAYVRKVLGRGAKEDTVKHVAPLDTGVAAETVLDNTAEQVLTALKNKALRGLVDNPFVLHMAVAGRDSLSWMGGGGSSGDCVPPGPVLRVEVYETYLRQVVEEGLARLKLKERPAELKEEVLAVGELLGCWMLKSGVWAGTVEDARRWLREKDGDVAAGHLDVCLQCLPVRLESLEDEHGIFTFTHKTIGEYLAARRLWGAPRTTLERLLARPFSKEAPNVLRFFAAMRQKAACDGYKQGGAGTGDEHTEGGDAMLSQLLESVQGSAADTGGDGAAEEENKAKKIVAANAMSLLSHGRYALPVGTSLRGVVVCGADLRHLVLGGVDLTDAVLCDNWFDGSTFHSCDLTRTDWEGSSLGAVLPPIKGHEDKVLAVALTPDGQMLVSGSKDGLIRVWDPQTGKEVMEPLEGHSNWGLTHKKWVTALTVTPDGRKILSGGRDNTIRVWDLDTRKQVMEPLEGHRSSVTTITVTPDGRSIVSGGCRRIRLWDIETGKEVMELLDEDSTDVTSVAVTPDGRRIVSGSEDSTIRVWDIETEKVLRQLGGHEKRVTAVTVTPDGRRVVSGSYDKTIRVWDIETGKEIMQPLEGHSDCVATLALTPDGRRVVSGSWDKTIRVWDIEEGREAMQPLEGHDKWVTTLAVTPDGRRVISGSDDQTIRVWELETKKEAIQHEDAHEETSGSITSLAMTPDGRRVVSGSQDTTIRIWDVETGKEVMQALEGHSESVTTVAVTPDGRRVVSGSEDKTIRVWDLETGKEVLQAFEGHRRSVTVVTVTSDGQRVISGSRDKTIRVWGLETGKEAVQPLKGHVASVTTLTMTPDGRRVVSGGDDGTIRVWHLETGKEMIQPLQGHTNFVNTVAVTPDGLKAVSGSDDETIRVWDLETGKEMQVIKGHYWCVGKVAVTPDGRWIVSGSRDQTVRVWDLETGEEIMQALARHGSWVTTLAVTPDGRRVVSGSYDKTIRVWDLSAEKAMLAVWGKDTSTCSVVQCTGVESAMPDAQRALLECSAVLKLC